MLIDAGLCFVCVFLFVLPIQFFCFPARYTSLIVTSLYSLPGVFLLCSTDQSMCFKKDWMVPVPASGINRYVA